MRIAEVSTLARCVPPEGEGSVELLVSLLTEELVRRGHDVTLYAAEGSRTSARLRSPAGRTYTSDTNKWDWHLYESFQTRETFRTWRDFDIIHCHSYHHGLLFCDWVPIPTLHSFHLEPGPDLLFLARHTKNRHLHFCSQYQARDFGEIEDKSIVAHGVAVPEHWFERSGEYLAYLGRFMPEKGIEDALRIAQRSGCRLKIAGPANEYFHESVEPSLTPSSTYAGEISGDEKTQFLGQAAALLYPLRRPEPFGLVMIEALMLGTPVVARDGGAVPEIVEHGKTGWVASTDEEFLEGIEAVAQLDRSEIRRRAIERFSAGRMADDLEALMAKLVGTGVATA